MRYNQEVERTSRSSHPIFLSIIFYCKMRERKRQTNRKRERQTVKQTGRGSERQIQTDTNRQTKTHTERTNI